MDNELRHHGVLGMKWGIRRTPAQLGHPSIKSGKRGMKVAAKTAAREIRKNRKGKFTKADGKLNGTGQKASRQEIAERKQAVLKSRSAKELYDNADLFTTQELQTAYNRLVLEQNIKNLTPAQKNKGEQFIDSTIKWSRKASSLIESGTKLYNASAKIYNATEEGRKKPATIIGEKDKKKNDD